MHGTQNSFTTELFTGCPGSPWVLRVGISLDMDPSVHGCAPIVGPGIGQAPRDVVGDPQQARNVHPLPWVHLVALVMHIA